MITEFRLRTPGWRGLDELRRHLNGLQNGSWTGVPLIASWRLHGAPQHDVCEIEFVSDIDATAASLSW